MILKLISGQVPAEALDHLIELQQAADVYIRASDVERRDGALGSELETRQLCLTKKMDSIAAERRAFNLELAKAPWSHILESHRQLTAELSQEVRQQTDRIVTALEQLPGIMSLVSNPFLFLKLC